jgi:DNA-binding transcriptional MerR regulator
MTVDDLARVSGVTTRNIRAYQARGLLPPPRLEGRTGYYGERHLGRLRAITRLLERGFSLASIRALLSFWEQGRTLSDALGIRDTVAYGEHASFSRREVEKLFPALRGRPGLLERAADAGLLVPDGERLLVPNPLLMEAGLNLTRAGVPFEATLHAFEQLVVELRPSARRYVRLLLDHVWKPALASGRGKAPRELVARLRTLVPIGRVAVASTWARELRALLSETFLERLDEVQPLDRKTREALARALASGL